MKLRIAGAAGGTLVVAGLVAGVIALKSGQQVPDQVQAAASPVVVDAVAVARPMTPAGRTTTRDDSEPRPLGRIVPSGTGDLVFYGVSVDMPDKLPDVHFGVTAGTSARGEVHGLVTTNETNGSATSPGFHAVSGAITVADTAVPTFGYYAGPAAKITGTVGSRHLVAHQAQWSEDSGIVFFWFDGSAEPANLKALDANGAELPAGNTGVGHG